MITGRREHFEIRCLERGYSLEDVRGCILSEDGDMITVDESHPAYPHRRQKVSERPAVETPRPPLVLERSGDSLSWGRKVKNFAAATAKHVAAGMPTCTEEQIIRRHDICMGCEFLKDGACTKCGCPVNRGKKYISKLAWADQSCPIGKWGPET